MTLCGWQDIKIQLLLLLLRTALSELSSCVKVEVAVLGPVPNNCPYGPCGRKATLSLNLRHAELRSRGGRPGLPVPNEPTVSVDVKQHSAKGSVDRSLCSYPGGTTDRFTPSG